MRKLKKLKLTDRETQVVGLLIKGMSSREIGSNLGITEATVKYHLSKIFIQTQMKTRTKLMAWIHS